MTRLGCRAALPWLLAPLPKSKWNSQNSLFISTAREWEHGLRVGVPGFKCWLSHPRAVRSQTSHFFFQLPLQNKDQGSTSCIRLWERKTLDLWGQAWHRANLQSMLAVTMQMAEPISKSLHAWGPHYSQGKSDYF